MMKKFFLFFIILLFSVNSSIYATQIDLGVLNDQDLNKQLEPIILLLDEAKKTNNLDAYYDACVKGYELQKTGNAENIKSYNDVLSAAAIQFSAQKYDISKDRKYLKRAYKWSKIAVNDRTTQIFSIKSDILLASMFLNTKEMVKAYELYRAVDLKGALEFQGQYTQLYDTTREYILERKQKKQAAWLGALAIMGTTLQATGNAIDQYEKDTRRNTTTTRGGMTDCYMVGTHMYCNSY